MDEDAEQHDDGTEAEYGDHMSDEWDSWEVDS